MIERTWYWLGLLGSSILLAIAFFYFQQKIGLIPCSLCMFQRYALVGVVVFCVLGLILSYGRKGAKWPVLGVLISVAFGLLAAGRQVWLQNLPADKVPECGPDLSYMMETLPFLKVISNVFSGSGECAKFQWEFLSLSMAHWMVIIFVVMLLITTKQLFKKKKKVFKSKYRM